MATAGTPILEETFGSLKLLVVPLTSVTDDSTYSSSVKGIVSYYYQPHGATETGTSVALSGSTFTFYNDNVTGEGDLFIYTKQ